MQIAAVKAGQKVFMAGAFVVWPPCPSSSGQVPARTLTPAGAPRRPC